MPASSMKRAKDFITVASYHRNSPQRQLDCSTLRTFSPSCAIPRKDARRAWIRLGLPGYKLANPTYTRTVMGPKNLLASANNWLYHQPPETGDALRPVARSKVTLSRRDTLKCVRRGRRAKRST